MTTETTKNGFQRCEFDDDTCENCNTDVKEIYFRPTVSSTKGQYWCMPCIKKEEADNESDYQESTK